jgi:hypothetical protein
MMVNILIVLSLETDQQIKYHSEIILHIQLLKFILPDWACHTYYATSIEKTQNVITS